MGFVLSRQHYSVDTALEEGRQKLSEYSGPEMVVDCHRCFSRLGKLERHGDRWRVAPRADRIVAPFIGPPYVRCRACSERIPVPLSRLAVRPFSVVIAGLYQSVLDRARPAVEEQLGGCAVRVRELLLSRARCADPSEEDLPRPPVELLLLVHKVSGARNPITDRAGLYTDWLEQAWPRCDVVAVLLLDVTTEYLSAMLEEQPTLRGLLALGRLIPVFAEPETTEEKEPTPEKVSSMGEKPEGLMGLSFDLSPDGSEQGRKEEEEVREGSEAAKDGSLQGSSDGSPAVPGEERHDIEGEGISEDGLNPAQIVPEFAKEGDGSTEDGGEGTSEPAEAADESVKASEDGFPAPAAVPAPAVEEAYWGPLLRKGLRGSVPACASFASAKAKARGHARGTPCEAELRTWLDDHKASHVCL